MQPMDFQEATASRILQIFRDERQNRILLADEVGLGKTIIAVQSCRRCQNGTRNGMTTSRWSISAPISTSQIRTVGNLASPMRTV